MKRGRPRKDDDSLRYLAYRLRMTLDEAVELTELAKERNCTKADILREGIELVKEKYE